MNLERIYLDYNATSPLSKSVTDWFKSGDVLFANPSSQHSDGKAARKVVNETRDFLFKTFHQDEVNTKLFFHSGATEAFHTFAYSFSEVARLSGKELLICFSKIDHPAVTSLEEIYFGPHVKFFELSRDKDLNYRSDHNFAAIKDKKDNNPELIILYHHLWVHNETGQISPLEELEIFKTISDLYIHVDAVQVPGKIKEWNYLRGADIWSFSAHKFGALKGIGFSFFSKSLPFHPLLTGGGQQSNLRSGTENVQGIKSIGLALNDLKSVNIQETIEFRKDLIHFIENHLGSKGAVIDGPNMASNTIYFYLNNLSSDLALALFDIHGIELSAGSACSSGAAKPSAVLLEKKLNNVAKNGLRLSMPIQVNREFIDLVKVRLEQVFNKLP